MHRIGGGRVRHAYTVLHNGAVVERYFNRDDAMEAARQLRARLKRGGAHNDNARNRSGASYHLSPEQLEQYRPAVMRARQATVAKKHVPVVRPMGLHDGPFGPWASEWGTQWFTIDVYEKVGSRVQHVGRYRTNATSRKIAEKYTIAQHLLHHRIPLSQAGRYDALTHPE